MKRNMVSVAVVAVVLSTLVFAGHAPAAVRFVDNNAPAGGDGLSWQTAFATVQAGIDAATSGDEVWVKQGTYRENVVAKNGVALYGGFAGSETDRNQRSWTSFVTTIDGNRTGSVVKFADCPDPATRVDGFVLTNGSGTPYSRAQINGGGIYCFRSSPTIANNVISGNGGTGDFITAIYSGGGIYAGIQSSPVITRNTIDGNTADYGGGILIVGSSSPIVKNNSISGNRFSEAGGGIHMVNYCNPVIASNVIARNAEIALYRGRGPGIYVDDYSVPTIANNTIVGNVGVPDGGGGISSLYASYPVVSNNIIAFNTGGIRGFATLRNNDVFPYSYTYLDPRNPESGDISVDPLFVDYAGGNYHLQPGSPCINAGSNAVDNSIIGPGTTDIDGEPRRYGAAVDIGADEVAYPDVTPPETVMSTSGTMGENNWYWSDVVVTLTATDTESGVARTEYSLNAGGTWNSYAGPFTVANEGGTIVDYRSSDNAGNNELGDWGEVKIDRIAPVAVVNQSSPVPANGATNVPPGQTIEVAFSENIRDGANFLNIRLYRARIDPSRVVNASVSIPPVPGNVLYIDPVANLDPRTTYRVVIPAGAVKDMAGHALAADLPPYSFTTGR